VFEGALAFPPSEVGLRGVWASQGYGYVVEIAEGEPRVFHTTENLCLEHPAEAPAFIEFQDLYDLSPDRGMLRLSSRLDPYPLHLWRLAALPDRCLAEASNSQAANFEALASLFEAHYCFFELYDVDWSVAVDRARHELSVDMEDRELFDVATRLLEPLKDAHIQLDAEIGQERLIFDGNPGKTEEAIEKLAGRSNTDYATALGDFRRDYWLRDVRDDLLQGAGVLAGNNRIQYGLLGEDVGYIAFASMGGFIDGEYDSMSEETAVLDAMMEDALGLFEARSVRGVVIDLSLNIGGYDFIAREIAGRFTDSVLSAYSQRACDDPRSRTFTHDLKPARGSRFTGPVVVLTSDLTVSAAEVLTISLRSLDNVTHAGERTRGAFSTVLTKFLPNGWELSLSNEVFADHEGVVWESLGVEPEVPIAVFDSSAPSVGHVAAVRSAAELLRQGR